MAKKFAELRRKMSPERQAQAKARTGKMLAELSPKPTWQDVETGVRSLLDPWAAELVLRRVEQLHLERMWHEAKARVRKAKAAEDAAELALTQAQGGNHTRWLRLATEADKLRKRLDRLMKSEDLAFRRYIEALRTSPEPTK